MQTFFRFKNQVYLQRTALNATGPLHLYHDHRETFGDRN